MRRLAEVGLFLLMAVALRAQSSLFKLTEPLYDLEADHLGNLYLLHSDQLIKTDRQGAEIARFSRPDLGIPEIINVYDPMRVLLHYPEFNQVVVLDNRLNLRFPPIDLFSLGFIDIPCVALADENFLWLYDQVNDQLLKLDMRRMDVVFRTPPLTQLIGRENAPFLMRSNVKGVYLLMDEGLARFDAMGNWLGFLPLQRADDLHLNQEGWHLSVKGVVVDENGKEVLRLPHDVHWTADGEQLYWKDDGQLMTIGYELR